MRRRFHHPLGNLSVLIRLLSCGLVAAVMSAAPALAAVLPKPVIVTLDAHDYVTYTKAELIPAARLLDVADSGIAHCHRANGSAAGAGAWKLYRATGPLDVDFQTLRVEFNPTRILLDSGTHDLVCEGEALGWQTGLGRLFRDDFDA